MFELFDRAKFIAAVLGVIWHVTAFATNGVVAAPNCNEAGFKNVFSTVDASGGGTVTFSCGSAPVTIAFSSYESISGDDVIDGGNKITFDGAGTSAFFQVFNGKSLTLKNLTLQHGAFNASHALENFGTLELSGVTVKNNVSTDSVIDNYGSTIISTSTFTGNGITSSGMKLQGAAVRNDGQRIQISNSIFSSNATNNGSSGEGGAISNASGDLLVVSTSFTGNMAFDGGAIQIADGTATVKNSTFTSNAAGYGAAIENDGGGLFVSNSTFTSNTASEGDGGAIWNLFGTAAIDSSQFVTNQSTTTGGAISCYSSTLTLTNSAFARNQSGTTGGAIFSQCGFVATNDTFDANIATGLGGGAIYQNSSQDAAVTYATITGNSATGFGGGIYNDDGAGGTLTLAKSIISANSGGNCDGVIVTGGFNLANDGGCGGVFTASDKSNATLTLGSFTNNGGATSTMLPISGNQAINFIPSAQCASDRDQRNASRPAGTGCDSGAVELNGIFDGIFASGFEF
jgi:predicted outer membrane repeat protein